MGLGRISQPSPSGLGFFAQKRVEFLLAGPYPSHQVTDKARARLWLQHSTTTGHKAHAQLWNLSSPSPHWMDLLWASRQALVAQGGCHTSGPWFLPNMLLGKAWPSVTGLMGT